MSREWSVQPQICTILVSQRAHIFEIFRVIEHELPRRSLAIFSSQVVYLLPNSISLTRKRLLRPIGQKTPITRLIESAIMTHPVICRVRLITSNHHDG